jgi:hypothetical protein
MQRRGEGLDQQARASVEQGHQMGDRETTSGLGLFRLSEVLL